MIAENALPPTKCLFNFFSIFLVLVVLAGSYTNLYGAEQDFGDGVDDILSLSLEELMNFEVTSAFKKPQSLRDVPAAVYVVTNREIKRSGATSIPDLLRMVPGVNVAKIDNENWAVSIRGFNGLFSDKLLVLMDGRPLYSPLFSGVFWDVQDTLLADIDRIEIIRGPGASSWGSNAVNGVINIITKDSSKTQGGFLELGAGTLERAFTSVRYGGRLGDLGTFRIYGKGNEIGPQDEKDGDKAWDDRRMGRAGFRTDLHFANATDLILQGDIYTGDGTSYVNQYAHDFLERVPYKTDVMVSGGNIMARFSRLTDLGHHIDLRFFYDQASRQHGLFAQEDRENIEAEMRYRFSYLDSNEFQAGIGYRHSWDDVRFTGYFFDPQKKKDDYFSLFFQNESSFLQGALKLILGLRIDNSTYSELDLQPTARLLYSINDSQSVWLAASKATRSPSRANFSSRWVVSSRPDLNPFLPPLAVFVGDDSFDSEKLTAIEAGYRISWKDLASLDLTAFANFYDDLFSGRQEAPIFYPSLVPNLIIPIVPENHGKGENFGFEITGNLKPKKWWRMELSYSYMDYSYWIESKYRDTSSMPATYMVSPRHILSFRSSWDITDDIACDLWIRHTSEIAGLDIPVYTGLDLRLAWRPMKGMEISVVGKDLLDPHHPEFRDDFLHTIQTEVPRSLYAKVTWHF